MRRSLTKIAATCALTGASFLAAVAQTPGPAINAIPAPVSSAQPAQTPSPAPSVLETVATDPAQIIRARIGQTFIIALRSNHSTGFSWQLIEPPAAAVRAVGSAYEERSALVGGGGQDLWVFQSVAAGAAIVTLRYVRPFEKGPAQMERVLTFRVEIAP